MYILFFWCRITYVQLKIKIKHDLFFAIARRFKNVFQIRHPYIRLSYGVSHMSPTHYCDRARECMQSS